MPVPRPGAAGSWQAVVARCPRREHVAALALWPLPPSTSAATAATPWSSRAPWWPPRATARAPHREGFQDQGGREVTGPSPPTPLRATYGNQGKLRHFTPHEVRPEPGKWSRRKPCGPSSRGSRPATARTGARAGQHGTEQTLGAPRRDSHVAAGPTGREGARVAAVDSPRCTRALGPRPSRELPWPELDAPPSAASVTPGHNPGCASALRPH